MIITAALLAAFAFAGTALVAGMHDATEERIADNERATLLRTLNAIVPRELYNNDITSDIKLVTSREWLGSKKSITAYRARRDGKPAAVVLTPFAPDGYNGAIHLLVAIRLDGTLLGVRVLSQQETPGLGDAIDISRTNWVKSFDGHSLKNPDELGWHVEKDGGIFDQFTGATISPRAVVKAVHHTLLYYSKHRNELFNGGETPPGGEHG
ncbi:MAG: electron transport complex subunit RsxG [Gammaproteobacteria bacterium]|nr:electron transport complex subunit RsxG [Gammaproteobacteria bacterium]